MNKAEAYT